jgi:hypothetical protein
MYYRVNDQVVENYDAGSNKNKDKSDGLPMWLLILIIIVILILLTGGVYYYMNHKTN